MPHTYQYPRPALTVDCVVFGLDKSELKLLRVLSARVRNRAKGSR